VYIILFIIVLLVLGIYAIYRLSDREVYYTFLHPTKSGEEAAREYLKSNKRI